MPIYKTKSGKYRIKNTKGESETKEKAQKRLAAIKISQYKQKYGT